MSTHFFSSIRMWFSLAVGNIWFTRATVASVSIGVGLVVNDVSCMCDLARLLPTREVWGDERDKDDISWICFTWEWVGCNKEEKERMLWEKTGWENICIFFSMGKFLLLCGDEAHRDSIEHILNHFDPINVWWGCSEEVNRSLKWKRKCTYHRVTLAVVRRRSMRLHRAGAHTQIMAWILERLDRIVLLRWIDLNFLWWSVYRLT